MFINRINGLVTLLAGLRPATVEAHCDTAEGPAVKDGRKALETGNINHALKWIPADGEAELLDVFEKALKVRTLGVEAAELADRLFLETLVRIHRMGEGVGFTGIQPVGTQVDPVVAAADEAIAQGSDAALLSRVWDDPFVPAASVDAVVTRRPRGRRRRGGLSCRRPAPATGPAA